MKKKIDLVEIKLFNILYERDNFKHVKLIKDYSGLLCDFENGCFLKWSDDFNVFFDDTKSFHLLNKKKYLNKINTKKTFENLDEAFDYIKYLEKVLNFKQIEQYFYFNHKIEVSTVFSYKEITLNVTNNTSIYEYYYRIEIEKLSSDYYISISFGNSYNFELSCTPYDENWSKNKRKIYSNIDDLFIDLESFSASYDSILIDESDRDVW